MKTRAILTAAILAGVLWAATPASAWTKMITVTGSAECADGQYAVTWTLTNNDEAGTVKLTESSRPDVVPPDTAVTVGQPLDFSEFVPGDTKHVTLTVSWLDRNEQTVSDFFTIALNGDCTPTQTTPPPTTVPPTTGPPDPTPPATTPPPLAFTGGNVTTQLWWIAGLLLASLALLAFARWLGRKA